MKLSETKAIETLASELTKLVTGTTPIYWLGVITGLTANAGGIILSDDLGRAIVNLCRLHFNKTVSFPKVVNLITK